jgi:CPA1 family monovalent cation:H+ antiporter
LRRPATVGGRDRRQTEFEPIPVGRVGMIDAEETVAAIRLFVAFVAIAAVVGLLTRRLALPYSVALVTLGLAVSILAGGPVVSVTPELVLLVLLPGLVFEAAYRLDWHLLRRSFGGIALLAAPGVIVTALMVAGILYVTTGLELQLGFVVGAMVSATDPVAVVATFRRNGAPRRLETLLEGESLFNDGTALVVFAIGLAAVQSQVTAIDGIVTFGVTIGVSTAIGLVAGWLAGRVIAASDDHLLELTITVALAYGTYLLADAIGQSGVIATVVAGVVVGSYERASHPVQQSPDAIDLVWEFIAFLLTAAAFMLIGFAIADAPLVDSAAWIAWGIVAVLVARAVVVYALLGGASVAAAQIRRRQPIPTPWLHVMFWGGLRGAVAVAMALSLPLDFPQRALLQQITFGVVLFTLLAQGISIDWLVTRLHLDSGDAEAVVESPAAAEATSR